MAVTVLGYGSDEGGMLPPANRGFGLMSPDRWITVPWLSFVAGIAANFVAMAGIMLLNRSFNLIRGLRGGGLLFAALFMLMQGASPGAGQFTGGSLMVLVALVSFALLYSVYQRSDMTRRVFLVFVMLGAGSLVQYGFIPYFAVMVTGCVQMRVMNMRALIAILSGSLVPVWILWAFGVVSIDSFALPDFVNIFAPGTLRAALPVAAATLVAMIAGCSTGLLDMLQVYARNAKTRALFGLMATTGIMTGVLSVIDFANIEFYLPLLNLTTAFFVTLLFSFRPRGALGSGTVAISLLTIAFVALYVWKIIAILM